MRGQSSNSKCINPPPPSPSKINVLHICFHGNQKISPNANRMSLDQVTTKHAKIATYALDGLIAIGTTYD